MAIDKHNFWDSNFYNHPALTTDAVNEAEKLLGVRLPVEFIELLKVQNGGYTKGFAYPMVQPTSWADDHVPLSELFGIVAESISTPQNILSTAYMTEEWGIPKKQVLLCGDGHWWITLDYRKGEVPTVSWIDTEVEQDVHIADSFGAFLNGLVSDDAFAE